jgi:hypothetical protein
VSEAAPDKKSIAAQIEKTIDGVLKFLVGYVRTTATIAFRWPTALSRVLSDSRSAPKYVYPYTYLIVGGFLFSLIIAAYPEGIEGIVDLIWLDKEMGQSIAKNIDQAFSLTTLLIGGFPTFIAVVVLARLAARIDSQSLEVEDKLNAAYCFVFGYQAAVLFFWFVPVAFLPSAGLEPCNFFPSLCKENIVAAITGYAVLASFPLLLIVAPVASLSIWRWRLQPVVPRWRKAVSVLLCIVFFGIIATAYAWTAGLPARITHSINPPPAPAMNVLSASVHIQPGGAEVDAIATISNASDDFVTLQASQLRGTVSVAGMDEAKWSVEGITLSTSDRIEPSLVALAPHQIETVKVVGTIALNDTEKAFVVKRATDGAGEPLAVTFESDDPTLSAVGYIRSVTP